MNNISCVIFCRCGAGVTEAGKLDAIAGGLKQLDTKVHELHDLCAFSISGRELLQRIGAGSGKTIILACYQRAVINMLKQAGLDTSNFEVLNFRDASSAEMLSILHKDYGITSGNAEYTIHESTLEVPAWFPVIDKSLCTLCGKCARFCLFGVYAYDKKSLQVVNPLNCKNNCPACGRTCPASAIIFPRLNENSVLSGENPEPVMKNSGNNGLFVMLSDRNHNRKNIFRNDIIAKAEEERRKALEELKASVNKKEKND